MKLEFRLYSEELANETIAKGKKFHGEYEEEARKFLADTKTSITISFSNKGLYFDGDKDERNIYNVLLQNDKHTYSFRFGDSINNTEKLADFKNRNKKHNFRPNAYSILSCMMLDYSEDFKDFCDNFGYSPCDEDNYEGNFINESAMKTYRAVKEESENLTLLFTDAQLELLQDIQ